jgi:hypothetical protein
MLSASYPASLFAAAQSGQMLLDRTFYFSCITMGSESINDNVSSMIFKL